MKTKALTFLLALTFLFLFSGSVFGGVFDKEDEITSLFCKTDSIYLVINMKEKTIKKYSWTFSTKETSRKLIDTIQIKKVTDFYIYGENKTKTSNWTIDRHKYYIPSDIPTVNRFVFVTEHWIGKDFKGVDNGEVKNYETTCVVGKRIF
jgi:hypothetical protein